MFFEMLSTLIQTAGALTSSGAAAKASNYNRRIEMYNSTVALQEGQIAETQLRQSAQRNMGQMRANIGASGLSTSGSAMDLIQESAYNAEMDALNVRYSAKAKATGHAMEANLASSKAKSARAGGYLTASGILLAGAGKSYAQNESTNIYATTPFRLGR